MRCTQIMSFCLHFCTNSPPKNNNVTNDNFELQKDYAVATKVWHRLMMMVMGRCQDVARVIPETMVTGRCQDVACVLLRPKWWCPQMFCSVLLLLCRGKKWCRVKQRIATKKHLDKDKSELTIEQKRRRRSQEREGNRTNRRRLWILWRGRRKRVKILTFLKTINHWFNITTNISNLKLAEGGFGVVGVLVQ